MSVTLCQWELKRPECGTASYVQLFAKHWLVAPCKAKTNVCAKCCPEHLDRRDGDSWESGHWSCRSDFCKWGQWRLLWWSFYNREAEHLAAIVVPLPGKQNTEIRCLFYWNKKVKIYRRLKDHLLLWESECFCQKVNSIYKKNTRPKIDCCSKCLDRPMEVHNLNHILQTIIPIWKICRKQITYKILEYLVFMDSYVCV